MKIELPPFDKKMIRISLSVLTLLLFSVFLVVFNLTSHSPQAGLSAGVKYEKATVTKVDNSELSKSTVISNTYTGLQHITVMIKSGKFSGKSENITNNLDTFLNVYATNGMTIIVSVTTEKDGHTSFAVYNYERLPALLIFVLLFLVALGAVGRFRGIKSIVGILFTFASIVFFFIPMLYRGVSPVFASVLMVIISTTVTVLLVGGWTLKSLTAIIGTALGTLISGLACGFFCFLAHVTGLNSEGAESLLLVSQNTNIKVPDLIFAAIIVSSLGAVMDLSMSIASAVFEMHETNPGYSVKELFASGMNIGIDMMGTMANTLILAFTGSSLNTLLLIYSYHVPLNQFMNMNQIAIEIIQGLSGSLSVILAVPIVAFVAAFLVENKKRFSV